MSDIQVVTVTDDKYAQHLGVMLTSLFENKVSKLKVCIHIIDGGLSDDNLLRLQTIAEKYGSSITFHQINQEIYRNFGLRENMSHAAYYKISIPETLHFLDKVIFLDCDLIITEDIGYLWSLDLSGYYLAAVEVPEFKRFEELNIPVGSKVFNSGVMVLNLTKWRGNEITSEIINYLKMNSNNITLHDQDAFNAIFYNKNWLRLSARWNQRNALFHLENPRQYYSEAEYREAIEDPAIIHYTGPSKPWNCLNDHPYKNEYHKYLKMTCWKDFVPPEQALLKREKLIVFGTGKGAEKVTNLIHNLSSSITCYVDNDPDKWDSSFLGRVVCSPSVLLNETKSKITIIIASMYYEAIAEQLKSMGFQENEHFIGGLGRR